MRSVALVCVALLLAQQIGAPRDGPSARDANGIPLVVLNAERRWAGADVLLPLTAADTQTAIYAIRAVGRLEDPALVPQLLPLLALADRSNAAADAIAQSLINVEAQQDPDLIARVGERFRALADQADPAVARAIEPLGRLNYADPQDVSRAERILARLLMRTTAAPKNAGIRLSVVRSLEALARGNTKLVAFEPATASALAAIVARTSPNDNAAVRLYALMPLVTARTLDADTLSRALTDDDEQVRRVAVAAVGGGAVRKSIVEANNDLVRALTDRSVLVRYEALRAYVRRVAPARGCARVLDATTDPSLHVVLAALDALGDLCEDDANVTIRLTVEARTPPTIGSWHREAHALVALAKRAPGPAAIAMPAFRTHPVWEVRMYAAKAAAAMGDVATLERLAFDPHDNVREAALAPLQHFALGAAEPALKAALGHADYQLLRTAALVIKDLPRSHRWFAALTGALMRATRDRAETSRDTRLALLDSIEAHGAPDDYPELVPLLRDFDPVVAGRVAGLLTRWKGEPVQAEPQPLLRSAHDDPGELASCVRVALRTGRSFRLAMAAVGAPITVRHFLELATRRHYYDGLTFHRVVPNFVVQGGSPGANEYVGQAPFMRDEIAESNTRGSVGLSIRGRNTGDAQFYINLVDNPRLDHAYTIFARVVAEDMPVVDEIQEGDAIERIVGGACR